MAKGNNYVRKRVARHITLSREADEFLRESVSNASQFIESLILGAKTGINPVLFTISQNRCENTWACPDSNRGSSPCKGDVITD